MQRKSKINILNLGVGAVSPVREIKKVKRENKRTLFQTEVIREEHSEEGHLGRDLIKRLSRKAKGRCS